MIKTRRLISDSAIPRFETKVVFPSLGAVLVTTITHGFFPFWLENRMDSSVARKDSANRESFLCQVTSSTDLSPFLLEFSPDPLPSCIELSGRTEERFRALR